MHLEFQGVARIYLVLDHVFMYWKAKSSINAMNLHGDELFSYVNLAVTTCTTCLTPTLTSSVVSRTL